MRQSERRDVIVPMILFKRLRSQAINCQRLGGICEQHEDVDWRRERRDCDSELIPGAQEVGLGERLTVWGGREKVERGHNNSISNYVSQ